MTTTETDAAPAALAIIDRTSAALNDVHSYAFERLEMIEATITRLKAAIVTQKNRSTQEMQIYVETVDAALRATVELGRLVDGVERALQPPKANGSNGARHD